jgi:ABC-type phosphate transport system ATPase subunit
MKGRAGWAALLAANVLCYCVLSFYQTGNAAPGPAGKQPFANSVEQRMEMIRLLTEIKDQLKQQNALLRSGQLKVVVSQPEKQPGKR